jgi:hypothetical protein
MNLKYVGEFLEGLVGTMPLTGHKELAISFIAEDKSWHVMIGNKYGSVMLGEVSGIYNGYGETLEEAIHAAIQEMDE